MRKIILFLGIGYFGPIALAAQSNMIHVFVALCDNVNQGIVPVPKLLGVGDDPK